MQKNITLKDFIDKVYDDKVISLEAENARLRYQIERMKRCEYCFYVECPIVCENCDITTHSEWEFEG